MNLQTERIENHRAQLTIEIEENQLEAAKKDAARQISQHVRIRGFRKGKAPYRLVAQYVGEATILEEAARALGDDLYKQALEESEVTPYGPGTLEEFTIGSPPTFVFSVPLQPEVDLKNYRDVRLDFEEPEVSDDELEQALQQLRMRELEVLEAERQSAEPGNRVRVSVDSTFVDGEEPEDDEAVTAEADEDQTNDVDESDAASNEPAANKSDDLPYVPRKGDTFVHDENAIVILDPNEDPFVDGFVDAIIGAELGSDILFELTIPDDDPDKTIANRQVSFVVTLKQIEAIRIPELDDAFAESISKDRGDEVMDMAGLRGAIREDLERAALERAKSQYSGQVLEQIVDGAEILYPELMLSERVDEMINEFEGNLKRQNLSLEDYLRHTGNTMEDIRLQYQEPAAQSLCQSLALRELVKEEEVEAIDEQVDLRLELLVSGYGQSAEIRKMFESSHIRDNIRNELTINQINERLCAIGRGEDPDKAVELLNEQLSNDAKRMKERQERLLSDLEEKGAQDSDPAATSESDDDQDLDDEQLTREAVEATSIDAADAANAVSADIDDSSDVE